MIQFVIASILISQVSSSAPRVLSPSPVPVENRQRVTSQARIDEAQRIREVKRAEFQERLSLVRDTQKQRVVSQIQERLDTINANSVAHFNAVLERLSSLLDRIETRLENYKLENPDTDTIAVEQAIEEARQAILAAQAKVNTQAGNIYSITITSEEAVGQAARATISALKTDLRAVQVAVLEARESVTQVVREVSLLEGITR